MASSKPLTTTRLNDFLFGAVTLVAPFHLPSHYNHSIRFSIYEVEVISSSWCVLLLIGSSGSDIRFFDFHLRCFVPQFTAPLSSGIY